LGACDLKNSLEVKSLHESGLSLTHYCVLEFTSKH